MKKLLFTLALVAFLFNAKAQTGFEFGLHVKPQNVWIMNQDLMDSPTVDPDLTFGFDFGLDANFMFLNNIGVASGVSLSSQGQKYKAQDSNSDLKWEQKLKYIKIPLKFRYVSNTDANAAFYLEAGPQFSFLTSAKATNILSSTGGLVENKENYKSSTTDVLLGFGTKIRATEALGIILGLEFDYALGDIEKNTPSGYAKSNNLTGGIKLGVLYHFGGN